MNTSFAWVFNLKTSAVKNGVLLLTLKCLLFCPETHSQTGFFPIGIFGATSNVGTPYTPRTATTLDKIRGSQALGYSSGFNVVQSYWHKSVYDHVSNAGVLTFLDHAAALGFLVLVNVPGTSETNGDWKFTAPGDTVNGQVIPVPGEGPHLFQRTPPVYTEALGVVRATKSHAAVYGYYIADEPNDVYSVRAFYSKAISAQNLAKAVSTLKAQADAKHPYLIAMADYDEKPEIWGQSHTALNNWRWNDTGSVTYTEPKFGGRFQTELNYSNSADIILNDTYVIHNNTAWVARLHKYDDLASTNAGKVHAVIECERDSRGFRNNFAELRLQIYTTVIHGVTGIWFYSYSETFDGAVSFDVPSSYFVSTIVPLSNELATVRRVLEGVTVGQYVWGLGSGDFAAASNSAIHYILKHNKNESLLIAANTSSSNAYVEIDLKSLPADSLTTLFTQTSEAQVLFETGRSSLQINGGVLADLFGPWAVHVYKFVGQ